MKKIVGIINDMAIDFDESSVNTGCGGSETWVIEIAKEFVRQGYYVYVFSANSCWHMSGNGVEYVPLVMINYILNYQHIDYFLISRQISYDLLEIFKKVEERFNNNIYCVAHDVAYCIENNLFRFDDSKLIEQYPIFINNINKMICMSNCGVQMLHDICGIDPNKCTVIGNGLDLSLFDNLENNERDNCIFWSSRYERNLDILTEKILPLVKKEIPDVKVRIAQYFDSDIANLYKNRDDIEFIGKLGKRELYEEMSKHKVWFYPNIYVETFCITVLEEAMCGCEIVMPYRHGPADTLAPFKDILLPENEMFETDESIEKTAKLIIDKIKNYDSNKEQRELIKKHIRENYSWKHVVEQYTELFNKNGEA